MLPAIATLLLIIVAFSDAIIRRLTKARRTARLRSGNKNTDFLNNYYVDTKAMYYSQTGKVPLILFIDNVSGSEIVKYVLDSYRPSIINTYKRENYNALEEAYDYFRYITLLDNNVMIDAFEDCVSIMYLHGEEAFVKKLKEAFLKHPLPQKKDDFEINIIMQSARDGLTLQSLEINPTILDIHLYYNDDFAAVDKLIKERLLTPNDKGIVLLHGLPGTGKTTYLRHLVGEMKKKVLFVSPSVAANLMNPDLIGLLIDNPNSILVIEDAENILMDRRYNSYSSVSNLLNLSDGLLSDCVNVQIICTFNSAINSIDSALLRKGRLIAQYEFGKLSMAKAQRLCDHLSIDRAIDEPMTLAEITNQDQTPPVAPQDQPTIGFRRATEMEC